MTDESIRAVDEARADVGSVLPVYQDTVLAEVPATSDVAELKGEPETRKGGSGAVTVPLRPSAPNAVELLLVIDRLAALSV